MKKVVSGVPVFLALAATGITTGFAVYKITGNLGDLNPEVKEIQRKVDEDTVNADGSQTGNDSSAVSSLTDANTVSRNEVSPVGVQPSSGNSVNTISLAELATHNTGENCYIAYNSTVYDVSNHPSWSGCVHHGIRGGTDITSRFPHPTSYLSGLPVIGSIDNAATAGSTSNTSKQVAGISDDSDQDDIKENENTEVHEESQETHDENELEIAED